MSPATQRNYIQVDESDSGSTVVFTPQDKDRFVLDCKNAVRCAEVGLGWNAIGDEIRAMVQHVQEWVNDHRSTILRCNIQPCDGRLMVYIVPKSGRFDLSLSDQLVELDLAIAEKFQNLFCDVVQSCDIMEVATANG